MSALKALLSEADEQRFPDTELVASLREAVETAEKCTMVAQQLMSSKVRTRTRLQGEAKCRLTLEELQLFVQQLKQLPCKLPESEAIYGTRLACPLGWIVSITASFNISRTVQQRQRVSKRSQVTA